jgi:hypothetical protein
MGHWSADSSCGGPGDGELPAGLDRSGLVRIKTGTRLLVRWCLSAFEMTGYVQPCLCHIRGFRACAHAKTSS